MAGPANRVFNSWKEITDYLGRTAKTCRRFERDLGLPIHRLDDSSRAHVFAYQEELDRWLAREGALHPRARGRLERRWLVPVAGGVALAILALFAIPPVFRKGPVYPPPVENSFLVAGFENLTGDRGLDALRAVLPDIVRAKLEQTGVRYVASLERMMDLVKQAGRGEAEFVDSRLGFELARRDGVSALVVGSLGRSGNAYVMTLRVLDVATKASLAAASSSGIGLESILAIQADQLCRQAFSQLGFSRDQMERAKTPVIEYTTSSLEAYKNFVLGEEAWKRWKLVEARDYLKRAVAIDPQFALAYIDLYTVFFYLGESSKAMDCLDHAEALRSRVSDKERLLIEFTAAFRKYEDTRRGLALLEEYVKRYPKDVSGLLSLATIYRCYLGRYDESSALFERAAALDPSPGLHGEIASNAIMAGKLDLARAIVEKSLAADSTLYHSQSGDIAFWRGDMDDAAGYYASAITLKPLPGLSYVLPCQLSYVSALKENWDEALRQLDACAAEALTPEIKFQAYLLKALHVSRLGRPVEAGRILRDARNILGEARTTPEEKFNHALIEWTAFWISLENGDPAAARRLLPSWPERSLKMFFSKPFFKFQAALARGALELAEKNGNQIEERLSELESLHKEIGPLKLPFSSSTDAERSGYLLASFEAAVRLAEGLPARALAALKGTAVPEPPDFQNLQLLLVYLAPAFGDTRGRALEKSGAIDRAIGEYRSLMRIDPERGPRFPPLPVYHYRLAKLYERKNDPAGAASEYRRFLDLWKDAEPGPPELEDARGRLAAIGRF